MGPGNTGRQAGGDPFHKTNINAAKQAVANFQGNPQAFLTTGQSTMPDPKRNTEYDPKYVPPPVDPKAQRSLTDMLSGFGIDYPDGPRATPALLTFLRGIGLSKDVAADNRDSIIGTAEGKAADRRSDLARDSRRRRENITADAESRGALVSGATNKQFARETEDRVAQQADIERALAGEIEGAERLFATREDELRQRALETTIGEEQRQATEEAQQKETVRRFNQEQTQRDYEYERARKAQMDATNALAGMYQGAY
jgi:hypothetical protein